MFDSTVTIGRTSAGNITFLIRLPFAISTFDDSSSDDTNQVHGSSPQKRNSAYGSSSTPRKPGRITENTNV